jgi:excisionase family DNA binding protein
MNTPALPELFESKEAAKTLRVSDRELKRLRAQGRIAFYKTGHRTVLFSMTDIQKFLESARVEVKK